MPRFSSKSVRACMLSCFSSVRLSATLWTIACEAPLSMGFSRQEYWSGLTCPPPLDLPDPGSEPESLISPALADGFFTTSTTYTACLFYLRCPLSSRNRKLFTLTVWGFFPPKLVCFLFLPSALWCLVFTGLCLSSELSGNLCYFSAACPY